MDFLSSLMVTVNMCDHNFSSMVRRALGNLEE